MPRSGSHYPTREADYIERCAQAIHKVAWDVDITTLEWSQASGVDQATISRCRHAQRHATRSVLEALITGADLDPTTADWLRLECGYAPRQDRSRLRIKRRRPRWNQRDERHHQRA